MRRTRKIIVIIAAIAALFSAFMFVAACGEDEPTRYTLTFSVDGEVTRVTAKAGEAVDAPADPEKAGYIFNGWYTNKDFTGEAVEIPSTMPEKNVTYYAQLIKGVKLEYVFNLTNVQHGGTVTAQVGKAGETVKVKDGAEFKANGYRFVGWSINPTGAVSVTGEKAAGQYNADDDFTLGDGDAVLYAQWSREYTDARGESADRIYVYEPQIGKGIGAATLVRAGKPDKLGFVTAKSDSGSGYMEFEFMFEPEDGGDVKGRFYDDYTYVYAKGEKLTLLEYDYVTGAAGGRVLAMDEYDYAIVTRAAGSQTAVEMFGNYVFDEEYGDYAFEYSDGNGKLGEAFFTYELTEIEGTEFDGYFTFQGDESGSYLQYDNGELLNYKLHLNGYGAATLYVSNGETEAEIVSTGVYGGTDRYEDAFGEWKFEPEGGAQGFNFVLSSLDAGSETVYLYIEYNAAHDAEYTAETGDGKLTLNGYGVAVYTQGGSTFVGNCVVGDTLITFIPSVVDGVVNPDAKKMYFNIDPVAKTFNVNNDGFVKNGGVLTAYRGESQIVTLPADVTEVGDNAFNYTSGDTSGVSLISVTIPANVVKIGKHAFENNYTLRRAVFLSETPAQIDFSTEGDPFRWPAGGFIIVVPEGSQDAYKAAWTDCPYTIKGSVEVTQLPEFETEGQVLVRYNKPEGSAAELDIKIPDGITEIASEVFLGADFLKSVDLNQVTTVGESAFYGCENLVTVVFTSVTAVGDNAFAGCTSLSSSGVNGILELPAVINIGQNAFKLCESLRRVVIGANITGIDSHAFTECQTDDTQPPLFIEFVGAVPPTMGEKIMTGNIAVKIQVSDIDVAIACFNAPTWSTYCKYLFIPSGDEKGNYMCGDMLLAIDGRAELQGSVMWLYEIDGENITFYEYEAPGSFTPVAAKMIGDTVSLTLSGRPCDFVRVTGPRTYTTADGKYTLTCNPLDLVPSVDGAGEVDATLNGTPVKIRIVGYNTKRISAFTDSDGKKYDITLSFDGETLVVTKRLADMYIKDITADDGSVINLHYSGRLIYVYGELKINVGTAAAPKYLVWSDGGTIATFVSDKTFTFTRDYLGKRYDITVTLSDDALTFEYSYQTNA